MGKEKTKRFGPSGRTWLWVGISVLIGAGSIYAVLSQSREASLSMIYETVRGMQRGWLMAAVFCMLGFIFFEACAIRQSCRLLDADCTVMGSCVYSAADIYFSAITPSASGGQPASACAMMQDGIAAMKTTAALVMNLSMYTLSLVLIGMICLLTRAGLFLQFGIPARIFIAVGCAVEVVLAACLLLLIRDESALLFLCRGVIRFLKKLHLVRKEEELLSKLHSLMDQYKTCAEMYAEKKGQVWKILLFNFLQRASQIAVPVCVYMAMGGGILRAFDLWVLQSYVLIGANYVPIPGGMGVTDYLMLNGFASFLAEEQAVNLELVSRSMSFYFCILLCGLILLLRFCIVKRKKGKIR